MLRCAGLPRSNHHGIFCTTDPLCRSRPCIPLFSRFGFRQEVLQDPHFVARFARIGREGDPCAVGVYSQVTVARRQLKRAQLLALPAIHRDAPQIPCDVVLIRCRLLLVSL